MNTPLIRVNGLRANPRREFGSLRSLVRRSREPASDGSALVVARLIDVPRHRGLTWGSWALLDSSGLVAVGRNWA